MAIVKGKWVFNDTLVGVHDAVSNQISVEFTIQDHELDPNMYHPTFYAFSFDMVDFVQDRLCYILALKADDSFIQYNAYTEGVWATAGGKPANKIDFGEAEQTVPDEFYTWLIANATPQETTPTAESVEAKIQALISAANAKTSNNDTTLNDAVNTLMAGYGQGGECDGRHVIDVEELPAVGEKGVLYRIEKKDLVCLDMKTDDGLVYPDVASLLVFMFTGKVMPDEYYNYAKDADTENFIKEYIYYVESEDAICAYDDAEGWTFIRRGEVYEDTAIFHGVITSIDQITADSLPGMYARLESEYEYYEYVVESFKLVQFKFGSFQYMDSLLPIISVPTRPTEYVALSQFVIYYIEDEDAFLSYDSNTGEWKTFQLNEGEDMNVVDDISKITEDGTYIVRSGKFIKYQKPVRTQTIIEPGLYDVEDVKAINIAYDSICGAWKLNDIHDKLEDVTTYPVKFTTVHEGNVINCTAMRFVIDLSDGDELYYILEDGSEIQAYGMGSYDYAGSDSSHYQYVNFGKEPQRVQKTLADFVKSGTPVYDNVIEISTESKLTALLANSENDTIYKYTGETTDIYENDALYKCTDGTPSKLVEDIEEYDGTVIITKNSKPEEPQPTLISFTIDGESYSAEEGMTWGEWCANEEYNTDGYKLNDDNRVVSSSGTLVEHGGNAVLASASPSEGVSYMTSGVTTLTITNSDDNSESIALFVPVDITFQNLVQSEYDNTNGALTIDASDNRVCYNGYGLCTQSGSDFANTYNTHTANGTFYYRSVNLISFTIDGESYSAEEGMTWTEWLANDDYNTSGFWSEMLNGTMTVIIEHTGISGYGVAYNDVFVVVGETIVPDRVYTAKYGQHTGGAD